MSLDAIEAIKQLKYNYIWALDNHDWAAYGDCFTEDATSSFGSEAADDDLSFKGRDAVVQGIARAMDIPLKVSMSPVRNGISIPVQCESLTKTTHSSSRLQLATLMVPPKFYTQSRNMRRLRAMFMPSTISLKRYSVPMVLGLALLTSRISANTHSRRMKNNGTSSSFAETSTPEVVQSQSSIQTFARRKPSPLDITPTPTPSNPSSRRLVRTGTLRHIVANSHARYPLTTH